MQSVFPGCTRLPALQTWRSRWETLCERQADTAYGGYAEYALASAPFNGPLPANPGFVAMAPILCAGVTVYEG